MKFVQTNKAPSAIGPYSQAVVANGMVFTSGQIALTPEGVMLENDVVIQTKQVLKNLQAVLEVDERGFINVDKQLRTNVPHIFASTNVPFHCAGFQSQRRPLNAAPFLSTSEAK